MQLSTTYINQIYGKDKQGYIYFASDKSLGYEYPLLSPLDEKLISPNTNVFNYLKLLRYAFASSIAYARESGVYPSGKSQYYQALMLNRSTNQLDIVDEIRGGEHGIWAVAIKVPAVLYLEEEIIIAYKGTSNIIDGWNDFKLAIQNFFETNKNWQKEAFDFCNKVINKFPPNDSSLQNGYINPSSGSNNIVLTGHSLGGYAAIETSMRLGILTRTFSAPATKIIDRYIHLYSNSLYFNNSINFVREKDPVVAMSGRHNENMVCFPNSSGIDLFSNHYLTPFINEIIGPLAKSGGNDRAVSPTHLYITPDVSIGAGIKQPVNVWK